MGSFPTPPLGIKTFSAAFTETQGFLQSRTQTHVQEASWSLSLEAV